MRDLLSMLTELNVLDSIYYEFHQVYDEHQNSDEFWAFLSYLCL